MVFDHSRAGDITADVSAAEQFRGCRIGGFKVDIRLQRISLIFNNKKKLNISEVNWYDCIWIESPSQREFGQVQGKKFRALGFKPGGCSVVDENMLHIYAFIYVATEDATICTWRINVNIEAAAWMGHFSMAVTREVDK